MHAEREINRRNHLLDNRYPAQGGAKMLFDRIKFIAQVIGFICIGLLAIYGGVVAATGGPPAWAAGAAAPAAPEAITPALISYQGTLRDASDNLADGTYDMVVKICQNADGTGQIWSETHNNVEVREGHFNLLLGEGTALSRADFVDPSLYIELTVEGQVMTPRQRFAAVPYAISATYATTLSAPDGDPAEALTVDNAGNVTVEQGGVTVKTGDVEVVQGGVCIDSDGSCSPPGDAGLRANGDVYLANNTGAMVGIGRSDPGYRLDVSGGTRLGGNVGIGTDPDSAGWNSLSVYGNDNNGTNAALKVSSPGQTLLLDGNEIDVMSNGSLSLNGNGTGAVGVGNDLNVGGNIDADSLTIDGHKPIIFRNFHSDGHTYSHLWNLGYSDTAWACGVFSIRAVGNLHENYSGEADLVRAQAYTSGGEWHVYLDFPEDGTEEWWVTLMCVDTDMVQWDSDVEF
jgi:hypothetical protein